MLTFNQLKKVTGCTNGQLLPIINHLDILSVWMYRPGTWRRTAYYKPADVRKIKECLKARKERSKKMNLRGKL